MKKLFTITLIAVLLSVVSCQEKKASQDDGSEQRIDSLMLVNRQKDAEINDLLATFNEIQEGLRIITEAEDKVTLLKENESAGQTEEIKNNLQIISNQMKLNRELINKLRGQLRESTVQGDELRKTVDALTQDLEAKEQELVALRDELEKKDIHIAELDEAVSGLTENVSKLTEDNTSKQQVITSQDKELHT
ncbi:MAG: hypothetical protein LUC22_01730, partial [Prevotella sp.]|nr:hypothetical protein [Prevotella sp.]